MRFSIVVPWLTKYLTLLRGLFLQNPKSAPVLIPIEAARRHCREAARLRKLRRPEGHAAGLATGPER